MRIALDAGPLIVPTGGVTRYTAELSRALALGFPEDEFFLLSDQKYEHPAPELANLKCGPGPRNLLERRWWLWGLQGAISRLRIDLFHGTDFSVPYLPLRPSVMTLHDLSPWMDPSWHADADRVRSRTPVLLRLGRATMVITPSETVRKAAMERFRISATRIVTVPLAASRQFRPVLEGSGRPRYFLYVGTLEPRKNLPVLIEAWREVRREQEVDLLLAGRARRDFTGVAEEDGLRVLGAVAEKDLPQLYSGALAVAYPSWYEGFGLPVLEAMQCGALVLASRDPAITELAGDGALCLDASDVRAWVDALRRVASDPGWGRELRGRAVLRAGQFSWDATARGTREVYAEATRRFGR